MIGADDVMPLLLAADPGFGTAWQQLVDDPVHSGEAPGERQHYLDAAEYSRRVLDLARARCEDTLAAVFAVIERLHTHGDPYVRELATIGYLEGIQTECSHATDVGPEDIEPFLGSESQRWWDGLDAFWSGTAPAVLPTEERQA